MNYYTKDITKKSDGTITSANNTFDKKDDAYSYFYNRMGSLLAKEDTVKVSMELIDENCIQYERVAYQKETAQQE